MAESSELPESTDPKRRYLDRIEAIVSSLCADRGIDLVEVAWVTERGGLTLRITIERPGEVVLPASDDAEPVGGVTLADCADLSRDVSTALDEADFVAHAYLLEVSSPGVERPLRNAADYHRFLGKLAKLKLRKPAPDGQRVLRGHLARLEGERITVLCDGRDVTVGLADVADAHLVFELPKRDKLKSPSGRSTSSTARADKGKKRQRQHS